MERKKVNFSLFWLQKNEKRKIKLCIENIFYLIKMILIGNKVETGKCGNRKLELPTFSGTSYKPNRLIRISLLISPLF